MLKRAGGVVRLLRLIALNSPAPEGRDARLQPGKPDWWLWGIRLVCCFCSRGSGLGYSPSLMLGSLNTRLLQHTEQFSVNTFGHMRPLHIGRADAVASAPPAALCRLQFTELFSVNDLARIVSTEGKKLGLTVEVRMIRASS